MSATNVDSTPVGTGLAIGDLVATGAFEAPAVPEPTPKKKPGRPKKAATPKVVESPAEGAEDAPAGEPATPKATPAKRGRKPKTPTTTTNSDGEVVAPSATKTSTGKRAAPKVAADGETPSKKPKATPAKATPAKAAASAKVPFPTCWEEFAEEDRLIVNMRRNKANWGEIEVEWEKITGKKPGTDVIRKKYAKLDAVATIFAPGDAAKLAAAKVAVEAALDEQIKKLKADKWTKIAEHMKIDGAGTYKGAAVEKKYEHMLKNGIVDPTTGAYTGPDESAPATNGHAAASGDEEAEGEDSEMAGADGDAVEAEAEAEEEG